MQENKNNNETTLLLLIILMAIPVLLFYFAPKIQWIFFVYWKFSKMAEYSIFSWIPLDYFNNPKTGMEAVRYQLFNNYEFQHLKETFTSIKGDALIEKNRIYWDYIKKIDSKFTRPISWLCGGYLVYLFYKVTRGIKNKRIFYNFESFLEKYSKSKDSNGNYKDYYSDLIGKKSERIETLSKDELIKRQIIPLTPWEFATMIPTPGTTSKKAIYEPDPNKTPEQCFDTSLAREAFDIQVSSGGIWKGEEFLTEEQSMLYFHFKDVLFNKAKINIDDIMNNHQYVICGLKGAYENCKKFGVFAPNWYRKKLKYKDYYLWRMVCDTGGESFAMGAGILAHYEIESKLGKRIGKPETTNAILGLAETIGVDKDNINLI